MKALKTVARVLCGAAVFILLYFVIFNYLYETDEENATRVDDFYRQEKNTIDVVCIGPSTMYSAFSAPLAFHEYGFSCYDYCGSGQPLEAAKYVIEEVRKTQSPKLYVIDLREVDRSIDIPMNVRRLTAYIPWSINRLYAAQGMREMLADGVGGSLLDYVLRYPFFHENWVKLFSSSSGSTGQLLWPKRRHEGNLPTVHKGHMNIWHDVLHGNNFAGFDESRFIGETEGLSDAHEKVLRDLCKYCQGLDAEVLFVGLPSFASGTWYPHMNEAARIVESYGFRFFDGIYTRKEMGIGLAEMADIAHLNCYGAEKLTRHLSDYIVSHYELPDHRGDPAYDSWEEEYREILAERVQYPNLLSRLLEAVIVQALDADLWFSDARTLSRAERNALEGAGVSIPDGKRPWSAQIRRGRAVLAPDVTEEALRDGTIETEVNTPSAVCCVYDPDSGALLRRAYFRFDPEREQMDSNEIPQTRPAAAVITQALESGWTGGSLLGEVSNYSVYALDGFTLKCNADAVHILALSAQVNTDCAGQTVYVEFRDGQGRCRVFRMEKMERSDWAARLGDDRYTWGGAVLSIPYDELPDGEYTARLYREKYDVLFHTGNEYAFTVIRPSGGEGA